MVSTIGSAMPRLTCQFDSVPCGSVSISRTLCPAFLAASASPIVNVLLPLPPFWVAKTIVCIRQRVPLRVAPPICRTEGASDSGRRTLPLLDASRESQDQQRRIAEPNQRDRYR